MEEQAPIAAPAAVLAVLQGVVDELAPNPPAPNVPAPNASAADGQVPEIRQVKRKRICEGFEIPAWEKINEEFDLNLSCCQPPNENLFSTTIDGVLVEEGVTEIPTIKDVLVSEKVPDLSLLRFRDSDHFVAGGVHKDPSTCTM
ncbi:uncharacterized protein LOC144648360 [Oculina patagonica]